MGVDGFSATIPRLRVLKSTGWGPTALLTFCVLLLLVASHLLASQTNSRVFTVGKNRSKPQGVNKVKAEKRRQKAWVSMVLASALSTHPLAQDTAGQSRHTSPRGGAAWPASCRVANGSGTGRPCPATAAAKSTSAAHASGQGVWGGRVSVWGANLRCGQWPKAKCECVGGFKHPSKYTWVGGPPSRAVCVPTCFFVRHETVPTHPL